MAEKDIRIEHLITGLEIGGAELMLHRLLTKAESGYRYSVMSLSSLGVVGERLAKNGFPVRTLEMRKDVRVLWDIMKLVWWWRRSRPDVVQTWLYHSDLIGGVAAFMLRIPVIWNVRQSNLDAEMNKRSTLRIARACARLSRWLPWRIVCGSESARLAHENLGYCAEKLMVIPNGFDLNIYKPREAARIELRRELGLAPDALLLGRVGRFDPQKDHRNFISAAELVSHAVPQAYFLMAGQGMEWDNPELVRWIESTGTSDRFLLLGRRNDTEKLNAALDVAVSSSRGEGFPNVVGEAMACGIPCVVTDVGDSARIVGATGHVVPAGNPRELAAACIKILEMPDRDRFRLGDEARLRIKGHYNLPDIVRRYENMYSEAVG